MMRARSADLGAPQSLPRPREVPMPIRPGTPAKGAGERRDRVRCEVHIELEVTSDQSSYSGVTRDLSEAGVFIATELNRPVGTLVDLSLRLPNRSEPCRCVGEVRWVRSADADRDAPPGLGLRFVLVEPEARRAIQAFLAERAPAFQDE
jgi:uncharacterized protein (TIGR02266 family)